MVEVLEYLAERSYPHPSLSHANSCATNTQAGTCWICLWSYDLKMVICTLEYAAFDLGGGSELGTQLAYCLQVMGLKYPHDEERKV